MYRNVHMNSDCEDIKMLNDMCCIVMDLRKGLISPWALYPVAYLLMKNIILCIDSECLGSSGCVLCETNWSTCL